MSGRRDDGEAIAPYQPAPALCWNDVLLQAASSPIGSPSHGVTGASSAYAQDEGGGGKWSVRGL